jgi:hypothetical protein
MNTEQLENKNGGKSTGMLRKKCAPENWRRTDLLPEELQM